MVKKKKGGASSKEKLNQRVFETPERSETSHELQKTNTPCGAYVGEKGEKKQNQDMVEVEELLNSMGLDGNVSTEEIAGKLATLIKGKLVETDGSEMKQNEAESDKVEGYLMY
ncbi:hypothetical protein RIF29_18660 [Crotalaria pallida]|uniref:Uncharacterized protein n=1 Tax=Crotalaria pallida TaxID=3830 RepID=A0AAN9IAM8_CROPI